MGQAFWVSWYVRLGPSCLRHSQKLLTCDAGGEDHRLLVLPRQPSTPCLKKKGLSLEKEASAG